MPNVLTAELSGSAIAQAATAILRADSLEEALNDLAEAARRLIGAHLSIASLAASGSRSQGVQATSLSDKLLQCRGFRAVPEGSAIYRFLCEFTKPIRLTQREVEGHPSWRRTCAAAGQNPPLRGCLAAPLLRRDGSNLGLMLLSDKVAGEFTADDETALVQLAEVAAAAIETHVALEDSQLTARRFHDFARSTSDWFWELDANLRFTFAPPLPGENDDTKVRVGIHPWELHGIKYKDLNWCENEEALRQRRAFRDFQFQYDCSDNRRRVLSVSGQPIFDQTGAFLGYRGVGRDLTEQVEARRQAELADARLAQAIEGLHDSFILWDADHRLMVANSCAQQLNGNQPSLVRVGVTFEEYIRGVAFSGEAPEIIGHEEEWLARRRKNWQLGNSFLLKRGEKWWLARDHHMADGGFATIATDVTSGKMATEALRERETRLLLALGAAEMGTWDWDTVADLVHCNDTQSDLLGVPRGEAVPVSQILSLIHPEDLAAFQPIIFRARDVTGHYEHEFRIVRPDGATRWLASRGRTLGEIGRSTRMIGVSFDVTERKEAEQALRASEASQKQQAEILQSIIASMGDGVYVADAERRLLLVNPAGASLLGYSPVDLIGRTYPVVNGKHYNVDGAGLLPDAERPLAKALRGEQTDGVEFLLKREDDERVYAATARPIFGEDGAVKGAVAVLRDVTEQRRTQRALAQAQKMEAVGQLTGGIAHDFNNLLLVISANSEMLMDALAGSSPDLREMAELSRRAAARGAALTQRLLAFSRQQALEPEALDIDRLVLTMADMLRRAIGEDMSCEFDLGASPQLFCADAAQLETALLNLALNARDAMPQGGRLTIRTRCEVLHRLPNGAPEDQAGGEYACIAVHDTGHGMSSETLARAFEPFFTTKEIGKGSGLGLSMVYGFARQVGGFVNIESAPGSGTTVRLYLRSTASAKAAEQRQGLSPSVSGGATGRILVVEDDPDVRLMVRNMLHGLGYSVATADNAILALTAMSEGELPDLVLSDLVMPGGMSGLECGKVVEARWPAVRMLYMSGYSDEVIRKHGNLTDASRILRKPYSKAELSAAIVASLRE